MNLAASAPAWLYWLVLAGLGAAAIEDMLCLRISNVTTVSVALLAVCAAVLAGPNWSLWQNAAVFAGALALGTVAFSRGLLGGGDVKLLAAVGLWTSLESAAGLFAAIFIAGGVVAVVAMLCWQLARSPTSTSKTRQIPYAVPIAVGAALVFTIERGV